jgi:hypothetical protein
MKLVILLVGLEGNFGKYDNTLVNTQNTLYDYASVMHYPADAFSANGLPTIETLEAGVSIGQRENLSSIDIQEVRLFYNCSATGVTFPEIPTTTTGTFDQSCEFLHDDILQNRDVTA